MLGAERSLTVSQRIHHLIQGDTRVILGQVIVHEPGALRPAADAAIDVSFGRVHGLSLPDRSYSVAGDRSSGRGTPASCTSGIS